MKFYIKHADTVAGVFILIAIAFLACILILMGINQRWFAKDYEFTSSFASGNGLSVGMPIKLKGFEIGKVDSISLDDHNLVSIEFHIYDTYYDKIRVNSVLQLATSPIGLGSTLVFHPGRSPETMPEGSTIPSLDFPEGKRLAASGLVELPEGEDTITTILGKVGPILDSLRTTVDNITGVIDSLKATIAGEAQGPVGDIVMDARDTIGGTKLLVSDLKADIGVIMGKADVTLTNLQELTADLKETEGLVTRLIDRKAPSPRSFPTTTNSTRRSRASSTPSIRPWEHQGLHRLHQRGEPPDSHDPRTVARDDREGQGCPRRSVEQPAHPRGDPQRGGSKRAPERFPGRGVLT
jgi:phospholipid/cholesterol/gamma-HCH transport system substrate-binding protein